MGRLATSNPPPLPGLLPQRLNINRCIICRLQNADDRLETVDYSLQTAYRSRVRTGPGKPGKSWNFVVAFSRTGKSWKKTTGPVKVWKSVKL